ncbi:hypothetical protein CBR_g8029 [Chara braunii]|uniref:Saposin B-type domain-containing protein n=1 Tax=Chara braunii TaxID=69332 RepID=A0A388KKZ7_CHABU|nr:hypothetical protein CBR_g8029 [Chara braunii]|eukprot:GBG70731.1 hypothetical protein CBR_g8029 [Chara braunii]
MKWGRGREGRWGLGVWGMMVTAMAMAWISCLLNCSLPMPTTVEAAGYDDAGKPEIWRNDLKYIRCDVCEEVSKQLARQVKAKREEYSHKKKKLTEYEIIELAERICQIDRVEGEWITKLDMVQDGDRIKLVEQEEPGVCNSECRTIQKACEEVVENHDTDVAELLFKGDTRRAAVSKLLCQKLSRACAGKTPPVPLDRSRGEAFVPKPKSQLEAERMMQTMKDSGMPGMKMYSREDLEKGRLGDLGLGSDDDDDDDGDSPLSFKDKLKHASKEDLIEMVKKHQAKTAKKASAAASKASKKWQEIAKKAVDNVVDYGRKASTHLSIFADHVLSWVKDRVAGVSQSSSGDVSDRSDGGGQHGEL